MSQIFLLEENLYAAQLKDETVGGGGGQSILTLSGVRNFVFVSWPMFCTKTPKDWAGGQHSGQW